MLSHLPRSEAVAGHAQTTNALTRVKVEIWRFNLNGTSFEDYFSKVAHDSEHLIEMRVAEIDLARLGFSALVLAGVKNRMPISKYQKRSS